MPNMPFFTLQIPTQGANSANPNTSLTPASLQKNTQTQALSPASQFDDSAMGDDSGASFSQTLNAQLQVPVLPVGQEFAAIMQPPGALQQITQQLDDADGAWVEGGYLPLQPLMNTPLQSAPLELQDIQRQRAQSLRLMPQATPADPAQLPGVEQAVEPGAQVQAAQVSMGGLDNQQSLQSPLPLDPSAGVATRGAGQLVAQTGSGVPALSQKAQALGSALRKDGQGVDDELHTQLNGELEVKNLHEKPLTLTTKTTLQGETFSPPPQAVLTEQGPQPNSELLMQGSTGFTKELTGGEPLGQKNPLPNSAPVQSQFKLDVPPSHPQWSEQIAKRIGIMSNDNVQTARIQLDPPELGALEVKIKIQNDHMTVAFASGNQQVREALEAQSPRLREMMEQQGINLSDVNVSDQSSQQAAAGQGQGEFGQEGQLSAVEGELEEQQPLSVELQSDSLVDYFA